MLTLIDDIADLIERFRRYSVAQWRLRGLVLVSGLVALLPLWLQGPSVVWTVLTLAALVLTIVLPRGHVATVFLALVVLWALIGGPAPAWSYAIVAVGCVGVHWAAGATSVGPSFAVVDPAVWRGLAVPALWALGGIVVATVIAVLADLVTLPPSLVLVVLTLGLLVVGAAVVLSPGREARQ